MTNIAACDFAHVRSNGAGNLHLVGQRLAIASSANRVTQVDDVGTVEIGFPTAETSRCLRGVLLPYSYQYAVITKILDSP